MKECSALLIIRETQIKTTMRHHLTPVRKAIVKKKRDNNASKDLPYDPIRKNHIGVPFVAQWLMNLTRNH